MLSECRRAHNILISSAHKRRSIGPTKPASHDAPSEIGILPTKPRNGLGATTDSDANPTIRKTHPELRRPRYGPGPLGQ